MATEVKIYFDTKEERDAYNAAVAQEMGYDMQFTVFALPDGEDEGGFYVIDENE